MFSQLSYQENHGYCFSFRPIKTTGSNIIKMKHAIDKNVRAQNLIASKI